MIRAEKAAEILRRRFSDSATPEAALRADQALDDGRRNDQRFWISVLQILNNQDV